MRRVVGFFGGLALLGAAGVSAQGLTVSINQAVGQSDPTSASPVLFTVVFSAPVADFATGDVTLSGTAGATSAVVSGSGTTYTVSVSGMTATGAVVATVAAGVAHDGGAQPNGASSSFDNTVDFVFVAAAVPTLGRAGLVTLVALLVGAAWVALRKAAEVSRQRPTR